MRVVVKRENEGCRTGVAEKAGTAEWGVELLGAQYLYANSVPCD